MSLNSDSLAGPDVALVRPRDMRAVPPGAPVQDPLGVGYLAATLRRDGHDVLVLDAHAMELDDGGLTACLAELRPRVVGLSLHSFSDYQHCVSLSRGIRSLSKPPYCIWGGEHATFHAENILRQHPEVDAVVLGEGEETLCELVKAVLQSDRSIDSIRSGVGFVPVVGAVTRGPGNTIVNGGFRHAIEELDSLPDPHKDIIEIGLRNGKSVGLSVLTGRGCTHRCRFCTAHDFLRLGGGKVWRRRSPIAVVDEVERLAATYLSHPLAHPVLQFQDVIFLGTSTASKRWIDEYVTELERRDIRVPFYCMARADAIIANAAILPRLVNVGLWSVEMGIESGVDRILQSYNKQNSSSDNQHAVELLRRHGVTFDASGFIMFDPFMTVDELRENALYLTQFGAATWDFFVTRLQLYPGTPLRDDMIRKGLFDGGDDIGRTSGYVFEDPIVGRVADYTYYYDLSIRTLDLALRDAKAAVAMAIRKKAEPRQALEDAIDLVHRTYCCHLLALIEAAKSGESDVVMTNLIEVFMHRVAKLTELLGLLLENGAVLSPASVPGQSVS
jgi:radical SAM superfamily enzyme YgiQ (UPF0313 family)